MKRRFRPTEKSAAQGESFLFESVEGGEHLGRYSFVGCNPRAVIKQTGNRVEVIENGKIIETFEIKGRVGSPLRAASQVDEPRRAGDCAPCPVADGLAVVERVMKKYRAVLLPGLPRFTGGAIGFIGYEFIHDVEPVVPRPPKDELQTPTMVFLIADQLLVFDRVAQTITVLVNAILDGAAEPGRGLRKCRRRNRAAGIVARTAERTPSGQRAGRSAGGSV